jgi:hypothetical protein
MGRVAKQPDVVKATKYDEGKPPVSLISTKALIEEAKVMAYGEKKYGRDNWRKGFTYSRLLDAALRHILAYNDGEDKDKETGISHLAHARCCLGFLLEQEKTHPELDDRHGSKKT